MIPLPEDLSYKAVSCDGSHPDARLVVRTRDYKTAYERIRHLESALADMTRQRDELAELLRENCNCDYSVEDGHMASCRRCLFFARISALEAERDKAVELLRTECLCYEFSAACTRCKQKHAFLANIGTEGK